MGVKVPVRWRLGWGSPLGCAPRFSDSVAPVFTVAFLLLLPASILTADEPPKPLIAVPASPSTLPTPQPPPASEVVPLARVAVTPASPTPAKPLTVDPSAPPPLTIELVRKTLTDRNYAEALKQIADLQKTPNLTPVVRRELQVLNGDGLFGSGNLTEAGRIYREVAETKDIPADALTLRCWERLAEISLQVGDLAAAESAFATAGALFSKLQEITLAPNTGYAKNRSRLDTIPTYMASQLLRLAVAYETTKQVPAAAVANRALLFAYPYSPDSRQTALKAAEQFRAAGDPLAAIPCYLRVLDPLADRCFSQKALSPDNQRFLDMVAKPLPLELVSSAISGLNACEKMLGQNGELDAKQLTDFTGRWYAALSGTFAADDEKAIAGWRDLAQSYTGAPWNWLCEIALARTLLRDARYTDVEALLGVATVKDETDNPYMVWRDYCLGVAYARLGESDAASKLLGRAANAADRVLAGEALLELALMNEARLDWSAAQTAYERLAKEGPAENLRNEAAYALKRIDILRTSPAGPGDGSFAVLAEDRTTRGNWPIGYGNAQYILCAQQFAGDRTGGMGPVLNYAFRTTLPTETGRCWVTKEKDEDPVALWDPVRRTHVPANRDDFGEEHPLGTGPDLLVDVDIPPGEYILAFYFVNDYNYYEPNRVYSISVSDDKGRVLGMTEVRHFGGGVYKRFAVRGPQHLAFRIWRNLSINTLLSGIFLDPIRRPDLPPDTVTASPTEQTRTVCAAYEELRTRFRDAPLAAIADVRKIAELSRKLEQLSQTAASAELPHLWYRLNECRHLEARFTHSEQAFDRYLAALAVGRASVEAAALYEVVAGESMRRSGDFWRTAPLSNVWQDGEHRWQRVWNAYFASAVPANGGVSDQVRTKLLDFITAPTTQVPAFVRQRAFDLLAKQNDKIGTRSDLLAAVGYAWKVQDQKVAARGWHERALKANPSENEKAVILSNLIELAAGTGAKPDDVHALLQELLASKTALWIEHRLASATFLTAETFARAGDAARALALLDTPGVPADNVTNNLREECRRTLAAKVKP